MPLAYVFASKKTFAAELEIQEHALMPNHNKYFVAFFAMFYVAREKRWLRKLIYEKKFIIWLY